MYIKV